MAEEQGQVDDKLIEMLEEMSEETAPSKDSTRPEEPEEPEKKKTEEKTEPDEPPLKKAFDLRHLAAYAALIASTAGLVNSFVAYKKAGEENVARESYKTVALAIERLSDETQINHSEIVSLRKYLMDHIASGNVAQQLDPPPPPPPVIESRPAPIVISRGKGGMQSFPSPVPVASSSGPAPSVNGSAIARHPPAPRAPAQMPAEWAAP